MSANKGEINAYREDQIQRAIALFVENDDMSTRKAAMLYGVFTFSCTLGIMEELPDQRVIQTNNSSVSWRKLH